MYRTLVASVLALASCVDEPWQSVEVEQTRVERKFMLLRHPLSLDVLFVVDPSAQQAPYADVLARAAPRWIDNLQQLVKGYPELHLAVTSSDPALDGAFRFPEGDQLVDDFFVDVRRGDDRLTNYDGALADLFTAALITAGDSSATAQPLDMIRRALVRHGDFARTDPAAGLLLVIITARPDASALGAAELASFLSSYLGDQQRIGVSLVTPEAVRSGELAGLLETFPLSSTYTSLDQANLENAMAFAELPRRDIGDPCFERTIVEASCSSWLVYDDGRPDRVIPPCGVRPGACFAIDVDPELCTGGDSRYIELRHADDDLHAIQWATECVTQ